VAFDKERFAEVLRALRHDQTVADVYRGAGITKDQYDNLEEARIERPAMETIVAIGRYYGFTPTQMAVLMGLWPAEEDEERIVPEARRVLTDIQNLFYQSDEEEQYILAAMLASAVAASQRWRERETSDAKDPRLPRWAARIAAAPRLSRVAT
jgi:transcriptional regulator with XRE-family HTH domain